MTDDSKEWVTIKIPASIRNAARDDARTYGQIMQAGLDNEPFADGAHGAFTIDGDPLTVEDLAAMLSDEMDVGSVGYDDVKNACAAAIREELEGV